MKRSFVSVALCAALFSVLLAACGAEPAQSSPAAAPPEESFAPAPSPGAQGGGFVLPRTAGTMHPILSRERANLALAPLIWEGLYELDPDFEPRGVLCQSQSVSADGLTWRFTLRAGVTFSDGSPLTAQEVCDSLALAKRSDSRYASRLSGVSSARADDARTVTVTLSAPNGALPALLDVPIVKGESEEPLGTGPYVLKQDELATRAGWWRGAPLPVSSIPLLTVRGADELIYAFGTGDVCLVTADLTGTGTLGYAGGYEMFDCPGTSMLYLGFQTKSGPCADAAVRAALSRGIDRDTVATSLYARHALPAAIPASPVCALYDAVVADGLGYSPAEMTDLLAGAGYVQTDGALKKKDVPLSLTMLVCTDNPFHRSAAAYLADEFARAGIAAELKKLSWAEYEKALMAGQFDLYLAECALTADFNPAPLLSRYGALNYGGYSDAEAESLLADFRAAGDEARPAAAAALYRRLTEQAPIAPICFKNESALVRWGTLSNLTPTRQNPFYGLNWSLG